MIEIGNNQNREQREEEIRIPNTLFFMLSALYFIQYSIKSQ